MRRYRLKINRVVQGVLCVILLGGCAPVDRAATTLPAAAAAAAPLQQAVAALAAPEMASDPAAVAKTAKAVRILGEDLGQGLARGEAQAVTQTYGGPPAMLTNTELHVVLYTLGAMLLLALVGWLMIAIAVWRFAGSFKLEKTPPGGAEAAYGDDFDDSESADEYREYDTPGDEYATNAAHPDDELAAEPRVAATTRTDQPVGNAKTPAIR